MEEARELLERIRAEGFSVRAEGGRLLVTPFPRLTPDQVGLLSRHKKAILSLLAETPSADEEEPGPPAFPVREDDEEGRTPHGSLFVALRDPLPDEPLTEEWHELTDWFLAALDGGRLPLEPFFLPQNGTRHLKIAEPALSYAWHRDSIARKVGGQQRRGLLERIRQLKALVEEREAPSCP